MIAAVLAAIAAALLSAATPSGRVPFVGCPLGGQAGHRPAPRSGPVPEVASPEAAARLAYYSDGDGGALAPRGWHCAAISGSSGGTLVVMPDRRNVEAFYWRGARQFRGEGIQLIFSHGGTSGRFAVAEMIARVFPDHMAFARRVWEEPDLDLDPLPSGPYPADRLRRLGPTAITFETPAHAAGLGTERSLFSGDLPACGAVLLYPENDMNLVQLNYRLSPEHADLGPAIVAEARRRGGASPVIAEGLLNPR